MTISSSASSAQKSTVLWCDDKQKRQQRAFYSRRKLRARRQPCGLAAQRPRLAPSQTSRPPSPATWLAPQAPKLRSNLCFRCTLRNHRWYSSLVSGNPSLLPFSGFLRNRSGDMGWQNCVESRGLSLHTCTGRDAWIGIHDDLHIFGGRTALEVRFHSIISDTTVHSDAI